MVTKRDEEELDRTAFKLYQVGQEFLSQGGESNMFLLYQHERSLITID